MEVLEREDRGSRPSRRLRAQGLIPGVLYGKGHSRAIVVPERDLRTAMTGPSGLHAILDVVIKGQTTVHPSILAEYEQDPIRGTISHIDLREVRLDQPIHATVIVHLVGESAGVKTGGVLSLIARELQVEALPAEVPEHVNVEVSAFGTRRRTAPRGHPGDRGRYVSRRPTRDCHRNGVHAASVTRRSKRQTPRPPRRQLRRVLRKRTRQPRRASRPIPIPTPRNSGAPVSSRRACLDAGSAHSRSRQSRREVRARSPQRGLDGRQRLARRGDATFKSKFNGRLSETRMGDTRIALLEPETYMNESGRSISAAARYFKVASQDVLVVHDDVDLDPGRLQARLGGGLAGHNGLRSIAQALGTPEFLRLRIGVGRPVRGNPRDVADYVLAPFEAHEDREAIVARAAEAIEALVSEGLEAAQRRFN